MDTPVTPAAAPVAPVPAPAAPAADPVKSSTMAAILGLVKPEETKLRPPGQQRPLSVPVTEDPDDDDAFVNQFRPKPAVEPAPTPEPPKVEPAPAPAAPAPAPAKVVVKPRKPAAPVDSIAQEVKKALEAERATAPATPAAPAAPAAPVEDLSDLAAEELEELELARYAETKDPARKGLGKSFLDFYAKQKKFLEDAAAKAAAAGEEYDPTEDPDYKKFVAKNAPTFSRSDRKKFEADKIYDKARADAAKEAEERLKPQLSQLEQKTRELEHRPRVTQRVAKYYDEVLDGMPEDVIKFHRANNNDIEKTQAEFPLEFEAIAQSARGARMLAEEFLSVKSGLAPFNPFDREKNPTGSASHRFLADFVQHQADTFEQVGGALKIRDGKTFVHPSKFHPGLADKHWTLDEEDVLSMLRVQAQREARDTIVAEEKKAAARGFVRVKKPAAPEGAVTPTPAAPDVVSSPRTPQASLPGASAPAAAKGTGSTMARILGLGVST